MSGGIFISYRRGVDNNAAGRLHLLLEQIYHRSQLFMDVSAIEFGHDFVEVLEQNVASCRVMLVIIGRGWLSGIPRLQAADDFVRIEIEAALSRNVRVVPVLIDGVEAVPADGLPDTLKPLTKRQAILVSHATFDGDMDRLIEVLKKDVSPKKKGWFGNWNHPAPKAKPNPAAVAAPAKGEVIPRVRLQHRQMRSCGLGLF